MCIFPQIGAQTCTYHLSPLGPVLKRGQYLYVTGIYIFTPMILLSCTNLWLSLVVKM